MDNELKKLNQFIWQPCVSMHPLWWKHLDVEIWQDKYQPGTQLSQRIDALVGARYGLKQAAALLLLTPSILSSDDKILLRVHAKLHNMVLVLVLVLVLGLFYLDCPDYLSLKLYRQALKEWLTDQQIQQAWSLWPQRPQYPLQVTRTQELCAPEELYPLAIMQALSVLEQQYHDYLIWQALRLLLPPFTGELPAAKRGKEATSGRWLFRLGSFL
ncbi:MAG: type III secretion system domain-containing protein [Enterobacteriaceae bacterium]